MVFTVIEAVFKWFSMELLSGVTSQMSLLDSVFRVRDINAVGVVS